MFETTKKSFITVRNEWWRDEEGEGSGFATNYSSHTVGFTYQLSPSIMVRPEVGYYHSYNAKAFDLGKRDYAVIGGLDVTLRFYHAGDTATQRRATPRPLLSPVPPVAGVS